MKVPAEFLEGTSTVPHHTIAGSQSASTRLKRALSLAALGVVFGDIGTSPLYTLKTVLDVTGRDGRLPVDMPNHPLVM